MICRAMPAFFFLLFLTGTALAQLRADWLLEYQHGRLPGSDSEDLSALYGNLHLSYGYKGLTAGVGLQSFRRSREGANYEQLHQRYLEYTHKAVHVRAGHFFTTLGRGLALRAFELPNVIFEQRSFRRRYAYYRDLDGFLAEGKWQWGEFTAFAGKPLDAVFPPGLKDVERRSGSLYGGQISLRPWSFLMAGDAFVRFEPKELPVQNINSFFLQLQLTPILRKMGNKSGRGSLYAEQARIQANSSDYFAPGEGSPSATYLALNLSQPRIGLSLEYKDYSRFETGINVPPLVYKEHIYYLLNRSTHELIADSEKGYQAEVTLRPSQSFWFLLNGSYARNEFAYRAFAFRDYLFEVNMALSEVLKTKWFYSWARDEIRSDKARNTAGITAEWSFSGLYAAALDLQLQRVQKDYIVTQEKHLNQYAALTLTRAPRFSWAVALERSTDPEATDDPGTPLVSESSPKYWLSTVASLNVHRSHDVLLFLGERRGGLTCLSGSCYEVLPFKGFEVRWIGRL